MNQPLQINRAEPGYNLAVESASPRAPVGLRMMQRHVLSDRELQTLRFLSHGLTTCNVAAILTLSRDTIDTHRKNILRKLNANNIAQAVAYCLRNNIIE